MQHLCKILIFLKRNHFTLMVTPTILTRLGMIIVGKQTRDLSGQQIVVNHSRLSKNYNDLDKRAHLMLLKIIWKRNTAGLNGFGTSNHLFIFCLLCSLDHSCKHFLSLKTINERKCVQTSPTQCWLNSGPQHEINLKWALFVLFPPISTTEWSWQANVTLGKTVDLFCNKHQGSFLRHFREALIIKTLGTNWFRQLMQERKILHHRLFTYLHW